MTRPSQRVSAPLVSVVMPVYNGEEFLLRAMRSILDQTMSDLELLVVDDGSTDDSVRVAESTGDDRVRVVHAVHGGEGAARNRGLDEVRGRWVAWHDADDVALPHRLSSLLDAVAGGGDFAHSDLLVVDHAEQPIGHLKSRMVTPREVLPQLLREGTPFNNGSMMVRRSVVDGLRFNPEIGVGVDTDFVRRFTPGCVGVHVAEPLTLYRQHERNTTAQSASDRLWPHVSILVEEEAREDLVPEAYRADYANPDLLASSMIGLALFRRGFEDQATPHFDTASRAAPDDPVAPLVAASIDLALGQHRQVLERLSTCRPTAPALVFTADACAALGDLQAALTLYRRALDADPVNYDARAGVRLTGECLRVWLVDDPRRRVLQTGW